ncbi:MAG: GNAT family N-acetyltransferase [Lachnospiraceae bacterium]|nr:GNAT family N-acetyltransferase [Lachnospiraceae bacterium]
METLRKVKPGDEADLAYIQTESWKAAFKDILDAETLTRCTNKEKAANMYKNLIETNKGNGYLLSVDGRPHCIAWWDAARDAEFTGKAELICIHSLKDNWHKGYGKQMMSRVLADMKEAGYSEAVLWVFRENIRARGFYEACGFSETTYEKEILGAVEVCYSKKL